MLASDASHIDDLLYKIYLFPKCVEFPWGYKHRIDLGSELI